MKETLGCLRRADQDFSMIRSGDRIAVGVSGGKDSLLLLYALALYRKFCKVPYTLHAVTLTLGFEPFPLEGISALCQELNIPYHIRNTQIGQVVFERRREQSLFLCAKMRRGALNVCVRGELQQTGLGIIGMTPSRPFSCPCCTRAASIPFTL